MNRRSQGSLPLSKAITGFLQYKAAEGLSPNTLQSYERDLKLWQIYAGDVPVHNPIHFRLPVDLPAYLPARRVATRDYLRALCRRAIMTARP